jgi:hypothetical protein
MALELRNQHDYEWITNINVIQTDARGVKTQKNGYPSIKFTDAKAYGILNMVSCQFGKLTPEASNPNSMKSSNMFYNAGGVELWTIIYFITSSDQTEYNLPPPSA